MYVWLVLIVSLLLSGCFMQERRVSVSNIKQLQIWANVPSIVPKTNQQASRPSLHSGVMYQVEQGDNLYIIAKKHRVSLQDIIMVNTLQPPYKILKGQYLQIPSKQQYHIQKGDSLSLLSRRFGVSIHELASMNNLKKPYILRAGAYLYYPSYHIPLKTPEPPVSKPNAKQAISLVTLNDIEAITIKPIAPITSSSTLSTQNDVNNISGQTQNTIITTSQPTKNIDIAIKNALPKRSGSFLWPVKGKIIKKFGTTQDGFASDGISIAVPKGTNVKATEHGVVAYSGSAVKGFGKLILIKHEGGFVSAYGYNDENLVEKGQNVKKGDIIAITGSSGYAEKPSLHFQIRQHRKIINPEQVLEG